MNIFLEKVKEENKDILFRLLQYSLYEESANDLNEINEDAIFEYEYFNSYFTDDDRDAYFIRELDTNKILGFAMINTYMQVFESGHSIAEFMVIPKYRRNHIGEKVAFELFDKYRGNWGISPSCNSDSAFFGTMY
jgi:predicted acetyltransferase